ncbi:MAG: hypothetical protein N3A01_04720 [Bacteroidales bacterium]|nr:hypothetical protein [Bacteroidales bacterium]
MKKISFLVILFCFFYLITYCQEFYGSTNYKLQEKNKNEKFFSWHKVFFGGNIGLQFGQETFIEFSPLIGYRITDNFSIGFQILYTYYNFNHLNSNISTSIFGNSYFARYYFSNSIFVHGEYQWMSLESKYFNPYLVGIQKRFIVHNVYAGGGYRVRIGERSYMSIIILYNLNQNQYSPYENPVIRVNFEL